MRLQHAVPLVLVASVVGCSDDRSPAAPELDELTGSSWLITEYEKPILDEEIDLVDKDKDAIVCVKSTPSEHLVLKDASAATPSQPCPPSFLHKGKGSTIKILKEWFTEDVNGNGTVCAKETGNGSFVVKDDNLATPSQPCPPSFYLAGKVPDHKIPVKDLESADENINGQVCIHVVAGSGNFLIDDDNLATPSQPCPPAFVMETTGMVKVPIETK